MHMLLTDCLSSLLDHNLGSVTEFEKLIVKILVLFAHWKYCYFVQEICCLILGIFNNIRWLSKCWITIWILGWFVAEFAVCVVWIHGRGGKHLGVAIADCWIAYGRIFFKITQHNIWKSDRGKSFNIDQFGTCVSYAFSMSCFGLILVLDSV